MGGSLALPATLFRRSLMGTSWPASSSGRRRHDAPVLDLLSMRLHSGSTDRHPPSGFASWPLHLRDACCLLVAVVFAARAAAGLVLPEGFLLADPACETDLCVEELESDEADDSLKLACLSGSLPQLIEGPPQVFALAAAASMAPHMLPAAQARGPPA